MAATPNPSGNQEGAVAGNCRDGLKHNQGLSGQWTPQELRLKHNQGLSGQWTPQEQAILQEGLAKYAADLGINHYVKIAMQLHRKTARDVALRCRWMAKRETGKRKNDDHDLTRKNRDKKGASDPSAKGSPHLAIRPNVPSYEGPTLPVDNSDEISYEAIGGTAGQLLEQNAQLFSQISENLASCQIQENVSLLCQARNNIFTIFKDLEAPEAMNQMPAFPVKLNEKLLATIIPPQQSPRPWQS